MAENRLPIVDGDDGVWGEIINQFLEKQHYNTGADNVANGGHKTITIRPGTTTAGTAPLKFSSGSLMTSAEAGAMEFLTDQLFFTVTTGAVRKTMAMYDDSSGATGDLYRRDTSGNLVRLPIGSNGDFLKVASGLPAWGSASLTKTDVGLGNVDNTSDANKPVSTATKTALYKKTNNKYFPELRSWNAALAERGTVAAKMVIIGDSITELYASRIIARINAQYNNGDTRLMRPGSFYSAWTTWTGSTETNHGIGYRGGTLTGTQEGTIVAICDGFIVSYDVQKTGGADMEIYIDNVLITTINTTDGAISGTVESGRLWTSAAITLTHHTLKIKRSGTGSVKVGGAMYNNGNRDKGVQVWDAGLIGIGTTFLIGDEADYQATKNLDPDLIVIHLGTNDYNGGLAAFPGNLTTIVQRFKADSPLASILLVAPYQALDRADWPDFVQVVKDVAIAEGTAYADLYESMGDIDSGDVYSLSDDNIHPNNKGSHMLAATVVDAITKPSDNHESPYLRADGSVPVTSLVVNGGSNGSLGFGAVFNFPVFVGYKVVGDAGAEFGMYSGGLAAIIGYPGFTMIFGPGGAGAYDATFFRSAVGEMTIGGASAATFGNIKTNLLRNNAGSPETVISAPVGAITQDTTNGIVYVKKTGTGNTGWQRVLGASLDVSTKTATTYTVTSTDTVIIADATSNSITITLPLASSLSGYRYYIKRKDSTANTVTIARTSSDTIDGATSQTLDKQYTSATIVSDGTNWYIL
ncbi:MAG: SGNH/GDSL hydrolase family protein [Candidatus Saccharimonadales bacterium]